MSARAVGATPAGSRAQLWKAFHQSGKLGLVTTWNVDALLLKMLSDKARGAMRGDST